MQQQSRAFMAYDPDNTFARILRGDLPCIKICENSDTLTFMDIMPQSDGHVLIVPKESASTIFDLSEESTVACIKMTRKIAIAVKAALHADGVVIMQVNGAGAGQTVPHVHFHVIPRESGVALKAHAVTREDPAKLKRVADLIIAALGTTDSNPAV
jgi:histidine triad (HIT) family protein